MASSDTLRTFPAAPDLSFQNGDRVVMLHADGTRVPGYVIGEVEDGYAVWDRGEPLARTKLPDSRVMPVSAIDLDAQRELARAARRIVTLEKALQAIVEGQCDARGALLLGSCGCCLHDRTIAKAALAGVE